MEIEWNWTDGDMADFPHLVDRKISFRVILETSETPEDLVWRIATEIYSRTGVVVQNELSVEEHVRNWREIRSRL